MTIETKCINRSEVKGISGGLVWVSSPLTNGSLKKPAWSEEKKLRDVVPGCQVKGLDKLVVRASS